MTVRWWIVPVAIAVLSSGCVGKKKYTALENELAETRKSLTESLTASQSRGQSLQAALDQLQGDKEKLEREHKQLQDKYTALVKDKSALDASVQQMQSALAELEQRKEAADARIAEFKSLLDKFKGLIDAGRLKIKIVAGRMVLELPTDILFGSGSASLSKEGKEAILEVAGVLKDIADREYQVEGHTDDDPISTERFPSNWELAAGRAITVVSTLKEGGVPVDRLSAASFAENRPVDTNKTKEGKAANRRIEIVVVPDLSLLPGYEELEELAR